MNNPYGLNYGLEFCFITLLPIKSGDSTNIAVEHLGLIIMGGTGKRVGENTIDTEKYIDYFSSFTQRLHPWPQEGAAWDVVDGDVGSRAAATESRADAPIDSGTSPQKIR